MSNSLFICMLKYIRSLDMREKSIIKSQIDEYICWFSLSTIIRNCDYTKYKDALVKLSDFVVDHNCLEIRDFISDLISMYYIMSDENEVSI